MAGWACPTTSVSIGPSRPPLQLTQTSHSDTGRKVQPLLAIRRPHPATLAPLNDQVTGDSTDSGCDVPVCKLGRELRGGPGDGGVRLSGHRRCCSACEVEKGSSEGHGDTRSSEGRPVEGRPKYIFIVWIQHAFPAVRSVRSDWQLSDPNCASDIWI